MESNKKTLIFDTSGINRVADNTGALARAVGVGYSLKITGTSVAELGATNNPDRRGKLLGTLRRLLTNGVCLIPSRWIIRRHPIAFLANPARFIWEQVDVRWSGAERTIASDALLDNENSEVLRTENKSLGDEFEVLHREERTRIDDILSKAKKIERPSFTEYCSVVLQDGGPAWQVGISMFKQITNIDIDEQQLRIFLQKCPPWRVVFISLLWSHYRKCVMDPRGKLARNAGRHDLMSSIYLPYCDVFVTDDPGQYEALTAIAAEAEIEAQLQMYDVFSKSLLGL